MTILCPIILCFMCFYDLLSKKIQKWPKTGFFRKSQFLAIFGFFYYTNQKNTINIKWLGIKSSLFGFITLGQNFQSKYEKMPETLFRHKTSPPPFFYHLGKSAKLYVFWHYYIGTLKYSTINTPHVAKNSVL